jgi:hypothetical protein
MFSGVKYYEAEGLHFSLPKVLLIMQHKEFTSYGTLECHEVLQIKDNKRFLVPCQSKWFFSRVLTQNGYLPLQDWGEGIEISSQSHVDRTKACWFVEKIIWYHD